MILLCITETIYAVLLLRVGRVVVHLCDHNYSYGRIGGRLPSVIVSPALYISTSRGRSKSRLCSGSDSHVSEFGGGVSSKPLNVPWSYGGASFNATSMNSGRAFERHCAKYCSIATKKTCASNCIITLNLRETPSIVVMVLIIFPLSLTFRLARGVHRSTLR